EVAMPVRLSLALLGFLIASPPASAAPQPHQDTAQKVRRLIDDLADTDIPLYPSGSLSGRTFSPLDEMDRLLEQRFDEAPVRNSETLRELVKYGTVAVPFLIEHLGD